ncbi:hypothetical protein Rhopal_004907-T1 [Rhodotorula paludigena]|uniref:Uncharacterized protein n=1 Tax=Rhodotorula paludigena TaxID=86838 RepID=A0AAV5GS59_9BASI|nr:hypothetical protein Rhopal_004907-T1 [Rhodotorula paludigena]
MATVSDPHRPSTPTSPPRPPAPAHSKIPRRRPSTHLAHPPHSPASPPRRAVSTPVSSAPSSPVKAHARRSSRTTLHFTDLPSASLAAASPTAIQDRRRPSVETGLGARDDAAAAKPEMRRTPSLSIYIPSAPSPSPAAAAVDCPASSSPSTRPPRSALGPRTPHTPSAASHSRRSSAQYPHPQRLPRTPYPKRPPMSERHPSASTMATYTSFDLQAPRTPGEEDEERAREREKGPRAAARRWWRAAWFGRQADGAEEEGGGDRGDVAGRARSWDDDDEEQRVGERTALLDPSRAGEENPSERRRARLRYIWGEVVCYAKHMLPPIFVFVVLVLVVALLAYKQAVHRIIHPPKQP